VDVVLQSVAILTKEEYIYFKRRLLIGEIFKNSMVAKLKEGRGIEPDVVSSGPETSLFRKSSLFQEGSYFDFATQFGISE